MECKETNIARVLGGYEWNGLELAARLTHTLASAHIHRRKSSDVARASSLATASQIQGGFTRAVQILRELGPMLLIKFCMVNKKLEFLRAESQSGGYIWVMERVRK